MNKREKIVIAVLITIVALSIVFTVCANILIYRGMDDRIESIENSIEKISNKFKEMGEVDTLILNMSEYNTKNIEIIEEKHSILRQRLNNAEATINRIDADLDAYD